MKNLEPVKTFSVFIWDENKGKFFDRYFEVLFSESSISYNSSGISGGTILSDDEVISISIDKDDSLNGELNTIVKIYNLVFAMSYSQAVKVEQYYKSVNEQREKEIENKCNEISAICDAIDDEVYTMATNVIELCGSKYLLDHDTVIVFQKIMSPNKIDKIHFYDETILNNQEVINDINPFFEAINTFADLLEEEYIIESEHKKGVAWELVKRVSVPYYSDIWISSYEKYLDETLQKNDNPDAEADGTLDRYIEKVILCNELNHKSEEVLAYFTYYMMEQGYAIGTQYFPAYFDICKQAFDVIEENLRKNIFRNKLKGNVVKKEVHYTIDDIDMMNGIEFENFIGEMFSKMGYSAEVTKHSGDQGIDVIAEKNNIKVGVQAKCYSNSVGNSAIQEAVAGKNYYRCDKVIVVTNNTFTNSAIDLAQANDVILWDRNILKEKVAELF